MARDMDEFDPDTYAEEDIPTPINEPSSQEVDDFDPDAYLESGDGNASTSSEGLKVQDTPPGYLESFARGGLQGGTSGYSDEAIARIKSMFSGESYEKERNKERLKNYLAQKANPKTYMGGVISGGIGQTLIPGANVAGKAGPLVSGAVQGAAAGYGFSDSDDPKEQAWDTATGGAIGGGLGQFFGKTLPGLRGKLASTAEERAYKANAGQNAADFKKEMQAGRMVLDEDGFSSARGRDLLSKDEAGGPVIGYTSKAESTAPKAAKKREFFGKKIGEIGEKTDEIMGGATISRNDLITALEEELKKLPVTPETKAMRQKLMAHIDEILDSSEGVSFDRAKELKKYYEYSPAKSKPGSGYTHSDLDFQSSLHNVFSKGMEKGVEKAAKVAGQSGDDATAQALSKYGYNKGKYGSYKGAEIAATERAAKNRQNRFMSPSDMYSGGVGATVGGIGGMMTGEPLQALAGLGVGATTGFLNKIIRERGSAFIARSSNAMASALEKAPVLLGKYAPILLEAQKRGAAQLTLTHQMLMATKPDYLDTISKITESQGGERP